MRIKLKNSRLRKGFSVDELATMVNISPSYLYKIESGLRNPSINLARDIAIILKEDMEELFFSNEMDETSSN